MSQVISSQMLIHPPGRLPHDAPKGLVDIWMTTPPPIEDQAKAVILHVAQTHALGVIVWSVLLLTLIGVGIWLWRDWRGHRLRWHIRRLRHLLMRHPDQAPEPIGAALMWALARYFNSRPGVDRLSLSPAWRARIRVLDALRFGPAATTADWLALLDDLYKLTGEKPTVKASVAST